VNSKAVVSLAVLVVSLGAPVMARAQGLPQAGGLFGGESRAGVAPKVSADLYMSVAEAYDSDTPDFLQPTIDPLSPQSGGFFTNFLSSGSFEWRGDRFQFGAAGTSAFGYFASLDQFESISHGLGVGFNARLPRRTTLSVNQNAAYSPSYLYTLFPRQEDPNPGAAPPIGSDYNANDLESYTYSTSLGLEHAIDRRTRVSVSGQLQQTDFLNESERAQDLSAVNGRAELERNVSKNVVLSAGYRYRTGDVGYTGSGTSTEHGLDVGMSYGRRLSATRRADVAVRLGGSVLEASGLPNQTEFNGDGRIWNAEASLGYEFSPRWQARAMYRRGVEHVVQLPQPVTTEGFLASLNGLWSRRIDLTASAGYSKGQSAVTRRAIAFDTYLADARVRFRVTDKVAAYIQYLFYYYDFYGNNELAPGFSSGLERNGVRAGLTFWVPALRR
jgi:hypothetical protein